MFHAAEHMLHGVRTRGTKLLRDLLVGAPVGLHLLRALNPRVGPLEPLFRQLNQKSVGNISRQKLATIKTRVGYLFPSLGEIHDLGLALSFQLSNQLVPSPRSVD